MKDKQKSRRRFLKFGLTGASPLITGKVSSKTNSREPMDIECDVVIIGSGPAGLILADLLSVKGVKVAVVESGTARPSRSHQRLNRVFGDRTLVEQGLGEAGIRAVGGTTHVWGGICPRFHSSDFTTRQRYQYGADWPISLTTLNHYYCKAERWLGVSSEYCDHGSAYVTSDTSHQEILAKLRQLGVENSIRAGMSINQEGEFRVLRLSALVSKQLHNRKNCQIVRNTTARKFDISNSGRVRGIECKTMHGKTRYLKCNAAVLAGGAIQNARLLMLNSSNAFPDGIGNSSGDVAGNLMDHPNLQVWFTPRHDFFKQSNNFASYLHSYDIYEQSKRQGLGSILLRFGGFNQSFIQKKRLTHLPESLGLSNANRTFMIEALCEQEPIYSNRLELSDDHVDRFGDSIPFLNYQQTEKDKKTIVSAEAKIRELASMLGENLVFRPTKLSSHHLMGTTRMSENDSAGVVNSDLKVFGTQNLFIAGASVFPTGGAANPTLTLAALSMRLAEHLLST